MDWSGELLTHGHRDHCQRRSDDGQSRGTLQRREPHGTVEIDRRLHSETQRGGEHRYEAQPGVVSPGAPADESQGRTDNKGTQDPEAHLAEVKGGERGAEETLVHDVVRRDCGREGEGGGCDGQHESTPPPCGHQDPEGGPSRPAPGDEGERSHWGRLGMVQGHDDDTETRSEQKGHERSDQGRDRCWAKHSAGQATPLDSCRRVGHARRRDRTEDTGPRTPTRRDEYRYGCHLAAPWAKVRVMRTRRVARALVLALSLAGLSGACGVHHSWAWKEADLDRNG